MLEKARLLDLLLQHGGEDADVVADEQQRHHPARGILDRLVMAHVALALHLYQAGVGLALGNLRPGRVAAAQLLAQGALFISAFDRGGDGDEFLALLAYTAATPPVSLANLSTGP